MIKTPQKAFNNDSHQVHQHQAKNTQCGANHREGHVTKVHSRNLQLSIYNQTSLTSPTSHPSPIPQSIKPTTTTNLPSRPSEPSSPPTPSKKTPPPFASTLLEINPQHGQHLRQRRSRQLTTRPRPRLHAPLAAKSLCAPKSRRTTANTRRRKRHQRKLRSSRGAEESSRSSRGKTPPQNITVLPQNTMVCRDTI